MVEPGVGDTGPPHDELLQIRRADEQFEIVVRRGPVFQIDGDDVARLRPRHLAEKLLDPCGQGLFVPANRPASGDIAAEYRDNAPDRENEQRSHRLHRTNTSPQRTCFAIGPSSLVSAAPLGKLTVRCSRGVRRRCLPSSLRMARYAVYAARYAASCSLPGGRRGRIIRLRPDLLTVGDAPMSLVTDRRKFLQTTAATGLGYWVAGGLEAAVSKSPNDQIQLGCIGVGGKGESDVQNVSKFGKIYALCDVDSKILDGMVQAYKTEHNFSDYREMLDKLGDRIDAVTISVPDHNHAVMAAKAMKMGKHVHCQKPLTHSIWEARRLGEIAREKGVATQMGNQWTAHAADAQGGLPDPRGPGRHGEGSAYLDESPDLAAGRTSPTDQAGAIDARLGSAGSAPRSGVRTAARRFIIRLHGVAGGNSAPARWATWRATRATCHSWRSTCAIRVSVEAECPEHDGDTYPSRSKIKFEFPELDGRAAFTMYWYDGGNLPPPNCSRASRSTAKDEGKEVSAAVRRAACFLIGDKAKMYAAGDYAEEGIQIVGDVKEMDVDYPRSPGHEKEWFNRDAGFEEAGDVELPGLLGPADRDDPARQPGRVQARPRRMGPGEPEAAQRPDADAHRAADVPRRIRSLELPFQPPQNTIRNATPKPRSRYICAPCAH